jgi:hypothetical protein
VPPKGSPELKGRGTYMKKRVEAMKKCKNEKPQSPSAKRLERAIDMDAVEDKLKEIQSDVNEWKAALKTGSGEANSINSTIEIKVGNLRSFIAGIKGNKRWTPDEDDKKKLDKIDNDLASILSSRMSYLLSLTHSGSS